MKKMNKDIDAANFVYATVDPNVAKLYNKLGEFIGTKEQREEIVKNFRDHAYDPSTLS